MCQIAFDIPSEVLYDTHMSKDDAVRFARSMAALGYYTKNNVSIGYCAQIAGMSEEEFMSFLASNHIDIFRIEDDNELLRDIENA